MEGGLSRITKWKLPSVSELLSRYATTQPEYARPLEITSYSMDAQRNVILDRSQLKVYRPLPELRTADLRRGFAAFIKKPEDLDEGLRPLMQAMSPLTSFDWNSVDIVTWRGVLTKILCSPWARGAGDEWTLHARIEGGRLYLEENKQDKPPERLNRYVEECIFSGYKFETLCMMPLDGEVVLSLEDRHGLIVDANSEFDVVFKGRLGRHRLLFGAEVDGLDEDGTSYLELKTTKVLDEKSIHSFENGKLMKWWTQSFLAGVPNILVGYRNAQLRLVKIEKMSLSSITRRRNLSWSPNALLGFGEQFFTWLKCIVAEDQKFSEGQVFSIHLETRHDGNQITLKTLS